MKFKLVNFPTDKAGYLQAVICLKYEKIMVETSSTKKVREQLADCTQKPIVIESLEQLSKQKGLSSVMTYAGASQINESAINIFLNYDKPDTHESTFVHEVLHAILRYEQYPSIEINQEFAKQHIKKRDNDSLSMLRNKFGSSITHPEIFRRMIQLFDLDINSYFENLMKIKIQRLKRKKESKIKKEVFYSQQDIMDSIDYFYYLEPYKSELIEN